MGDKLSLSIEPIENGYIITRPSPNGEGSGKIWREHPVTAIRELRVALDLAEKELVEDAKPQPAQSAKPLGQQGPKP